MSAAKPAPGFYGNDFNLIVVMPSGRIWIVESDDDSAAVRELSELPEDVEFYPDTFPQEIAEAYLSMIEEASGDSV